MKRCNPCIPAILLLALAASTAGALGQESGEGAKPDRPLSDLLVAAQAAYDEHRLDEALELAKKAETDEARTPHQKAAEALQEAVAIRRASPKTGERRSLRMISAELEKAGCLNECGRPYPHPDR